jgi:hypothetical protein
VRLRTVNLEKSAGEYTCLSYAWVDEHQSETILVSNFYCPVTRNLHLQLSRLRALGHVQDLWVDSISIDQGTTTERSIQVALMGVIFSNAMREAYCSGPLCSRKGCKTCHTDHIFAISNVLLSINLPLKVSPPTNYVAY